MADRKRIGIAWSNKPDTYSYRGIIDAAGETLADVVILDMARSYDLEYDERGSLRSGKDSADMLTAEAAGLVKVSTWKNSNVPELMDGIDCVIFPGGWDICPALMDEEVPECDIDRSQPHSAERDVSDYILMSYCIHHDIPVLCICRGMQMLAAVSGAGIIQDIGVYFAAAGIEYDDSHKDPEQRAYVPHPVDVLSHDSMLYKITGMDVIGKVPSWHHQIVGDVSGTGLTVTGITDTQGLPVIEAVERADRSFCVGVQFHPEIAVRKTLENDPGAEDFMDYDTAMSLFNALVSCSP